jgi:diaminopimelate epimerase
MDVEFIKLHSCGRDFILLDTTKTEMPEELGWHSLSKAISHRHFGVGGFGFLVLGKRNEGPIGLKLLESEGIESEAGPDALLCGARYAFDAGLLGKENSQIHFMNGSFHVEMIDGRNVTVELGPPYRWRDGRELKETSNLDIDERIAIGKKDYTITPLEFFDVHSVTFDSESSINLPRLGRYLARLSVFPEKPTVELVRVYSRDEINVRIWSQAGREVYSSSAGDGAAVVAAVIHGFTDREVLVHNRGGDIFVKWGESNNRIYVTSSVEYSFIGTYYWDAEEESLGPDI